MLEPDERRQLLGAWNQTDRQPARVRISDLVAVQADRQPQAPALRRNGEEISYARLLAESTRLAHHLHAFGAVPETHVAICLERSSELVFALLATLQTGAAYVPLDPAYPAERLRFMLGDSGCRLLLTSRKLADLIPVTDTVTVVYLEDERPAAPNPSELPVHRPADQQLAYVLYTSGSTGRPKGVAVSHEALANQIRWVCRRFEIGPRDRMLFKTPVSFDASVWEWAAPLAAGARLALAPDGAEALPAQLLDALRSERATLLQVVPTLLDGLIEADSEGVLGELRILFCGGEALSAASARRFNDRYGVPLVNLYGPSEVTVNSVFAQLAGVPENGTVPIGGPVDNTRAYVLDTHLAPVPIGVTGELYLAGKGLARGYAGRPGLTAAGFIPSPFADQGGERLYRSGDLVCRDPAGRLIFIGRADQQVKLRGFRVEPGEIEAVLTSAPGVAKAVVTTKRDSLVAYLETAQPAPTADSVRAHLGSLLPHFMMPTAFVFLERLPLTPNGKLDRKALQAFDIEDERAYRAPRNQIETLLCNIWADVLELERVGIDDNFFDLGGHSLLANQVVVRLQSALGVSLPLRTLFQAPTPAGLASALGESGNTKRLPPLTRAEPGDAPLSFPQQRLWFLHRLEQMDAVYNMSLVLELAGELDVAALDSAMETLVQRHEALRTVFLEDAGRPYRHLVPYHGPALEIVDLAALPAARIHNLTEELIRRQVARTFDFETGPLWHLLLIRKRIDRSFLVLCMHHIISDGWSLGVLMEEMGAGYAAEVHTHETARRTELQFGFGDYARRQNDIFERGLLDEQIAWWREYLNGVPATHHLPVRENLPTPRTFLGRTLHFQLEPELTARLKRGARDADATLFMILQAAFVVLLQRYSGHDDVVMGTPIANRNLEDLEPLIGFFANTLVLRTDAGGDPSFRELLTRSREGALGAFSNQDLPFERVVEAVRPDRLRSHNPLFQVMFVLANTPVKAPELPGLEATIHPVNHLTAPFDIVLSLGEADGLLEGSLNYSTDHFDDSLMARFLEHYKNLLHAVTTQPEQRLSRLPLFGQEEREQILFAWNETTMPGLDRRCVHQMVADQAARTPQAPALTFHGLDGRTVWDYQTLLSRADALAARLVAMGAGPETIVAICIERSLEMALAVLGVLRAGAAYLPLNPADPGERLTFELVDSGAAMVLIGAEPSAALQACDIPMLSVNGESETAEVELPSPSPEHVAYLIYTSGSTGKPKGVAMNHGAATNLIAWHLETLPAGYTTLQFAALTFDVSFQEMFTTWASGGQLILFPEAWRADARTLLALVEEAGIQRLFLPFVVLDHFAETTREEGIRLSAPREFITAGEQLRITPALIEMFERLPNAELHNHYGPTETHLATSFILTGESSGWPALPPIGRPMGNAGIYLLDRHMQPVPIGVEGELFIGGAGPARGYQGRPALTAGRYLPHPFSHNPGLRLYRTGDLARYADDGTLHFRGRVDHQVKIRGFRVEPGEIESVLDHHPAVRKSAVIVRDDERGAKQLIAYLEVSDENTPATLKAYLADQLPEYMVPAHLVLLADLPLNNSGKVDRKALAAMPVSHLDETTADAAAPRTQTEEVIAAIWSAVLGFRVVDVNADFFDLGGHSLLATRVIARVRQAFDVELPLRTLFETGNIAGLAVALEAQRTIASSTRLSRPVPVPRDPAPPLSLAQQRLWFLYQLEGPSATYNLAATLRLDGHLDVLALELSLQQMVTRHETLRTTFTEVDGRPGQVIHPPSFRLNVSDVGPGGEAAALAQADRETLTPFLLEHGPLLRVHLLRLDEERHLLVLNMHHIISDGWSLSIVVREITRGYAAFVTESTDESTSLSIQYADFAAWQQGWLAAGVLESQLNYWREQLAELTTLDFPTDRPRPVMLTYRGDSVSCLLPEELSEEIRRYGREHGASLFMTLLAAFKLILARYSGQDDIVVGAPSSGRHHPGTEDLIGFFINHLVLRTTVDDELDFARLLASVRRTVLAADEHQDLPFEKLVEELNPNRDTSRNPLFQIYFNMFDLSLEVDAPTGLTVSSVNTPDIGSKFDLTVYADDTPEGIRLSFHFNKQLFEKAAIEALLDQYRGLLAQLVRNEESKLASFELVTPETNRQIPDPTELLSEEWVGSVAEMLADHAARVPERIAVIDGSTRLSYGRLYDMVRALRHDLRLRHIGKGDVVAILAARDAALAPAIYAVLEAGAAFLLLDPDYPESRLLTLLDLARPAGWLHIAPHEPLPERLQARVAEFELSLELSLDRWPEGVSEPIDVVSVGADDLAYIAFTSGSTGVPKGIVGRHGPLTHFMPWTVETFGLHSEQRYSMLSGLAHDPLQRDIFTPLSLGACLCVPHDDDRVPGRLARWLADQRINVAQLTPAMGRIITLEADEVRLPHLQTAFFVGEALTVDEVSRLQQHAPNLQVVNTYGSTETQRSVGYYPVPKNLATWGGKPVLPLGKGIEDTQLLVLNRAGRLAGPGELGEIYMRSPHLAWGYLNDPMLTEAGFLTNPFAVHEDGRDRLYRTGDMGRYRWDGNVVFAGRRDAQVKLRGFRIELAEIETVLSRHEGVAEAVVLLRGQHPDQHLVAWYVPAAEPVDEERLRAWLRRELPAYMAPAAFVHLHAWPLTTNGKLDHTALPEPEAPAAAEFVAPVTPMQEVVAAIWAEVLDQERIGLSRDFFALGGHSLLVTQIVSRLRRTIGVELPLRAFFEATTVEAQAALCQAALDRDSTPALPAIHPVPRQRLGGESPIPGMADPDPASGATMPLSYAQNRLWFINQLDRGDGSGAEAAYNMPAVFYLKGHLSVPDLEQVLEAIVTRHEVLRTSFPAQGGIPVQLIVSSFEVELRLVDLTALSPVEQESRAEALAATEIQRPFQLDRDLMIRTVVVRLAPQRHLLILTMHHIASDGWSIGVLVRELNHLYRSFIDDRNPTLPNLSIQYADFAHWQQQLLQGAYLHQRLDYWREHLAGVPVLHQLPTDRPRPAVMSARGAEVRFGLDRDTADALVTLSQVQGTTLFMTLHAAFAALLYRYGGEPDVCLGTQVANRNQKEIEDLIGFFVNMLVLRTDLSGDPSFSELLARVKRTDLDAYAHADIPFERVVEALQPERSLSQTPLFQIVFSLRTTPLGSFDLPGLTMAPAENRQVVAKYDLFVRLDEHERGLDGCFEYNADLFDEATMRRLAAHYCNLLTAVAVDATRRLEDLPLCDEAECAELLHIWQRDYAYHADNESPHRLFEAVAARLPQKSALSMPDGDTLTYAELNRAANRLAHRLTALGVRPDEPVGLCMERSLELLVGLLAILKAGAAYLPLDPAYPEDRLGYMVEDAGIRLLLTTEASADSLPPHRAQVVKVTPDGAAGEPDTNLSAQHGGDLGAYIIYTSGSTGRPKGVVMSRGQITRLLAATREEYRFDEYDVWPLFHSFAFDVSVWEIWGSLLFGGRLVVVPYYTTRTPEAFYRLLCQEGVTVLNQTPTAFSQLTRVAELEQGRHNLRLIIFAGEALKPAHTEPWFRLFGDRTRLVNMYGITETCVHVTVHTVSPEETGSPIGRAMADQLIYLLDRRGRPTPVGVTGEIHVAGGGLARAYHNRPALTAERFVPNPFPSGEQDGSRLYRSGDLARYLPDGSLVYLGRRDRQVKLRGFRIEPGEIEARLAAQPGVREATVLLTGRGDEAALAAYLVPEPETAAARGLQSDVDFAQLPNGMEAAFANRGETEFLYTEIFEERAYLKHGIRLREDAIIFDVGANIGMATLFFGHVVPKARVFAFEPIPPLFDLLETNVCIHGVRAELFRQGLASSPGRATFDYYPHVSIISGRFADAGQEREVVRSFLLSQQEGPSDARVQADIETLLDDRLESERFDCELVTFSDVVRAHGLERVDLLKIDVEKSELEVLGGIEPDHWAIIDQIVIEVHDQDGALDRVTGLLREHGFVMEIARDNSLVETELYNIYARREGIHGVGEPPEQTRSSWLGATRLVANVRTALSRNMPEYMVPATITPLASLPLTPNGKVDYAALPRPQAIKTKPYRAPRNEVEERLAVIFSEVLSLERVGVDDNFFELGGHSLMAARVLARIRESFDLSLPLAELFAEPTIAGLAEVIFLTASDETNANGEAFAEEGDI
ncbi:MAG: amino acid adenylation domain-containing protein [Acidobacteriota bacterium]|nr:amino acid adenylation domain-containing protein [Acidobacteriota bacterium]